MMTDRQEGSLEELEQMGLDAATVRHSGELTTGGGVAPGGDVLEEGAAGRWPQVEDLLNSGVDVGAKTVTDRLSLLHLCAVNGIPRAALMLLSRGAELNSRDAQGRTPTQIAKAVGNLPVYEVLKSYGGEEEAHFGQA